VRSSWLGLAARVASLGVRFYPKNSHGVLVDLDYRLDMDIDNDAPFICIFDCPPQLWTEFVVVHAGYAYRYVLGPRESDA
jgi:hypothetical protein